MKSFIPNSLGGRTLLVLLVGLTFSHILSMGLYLTDRTQLLALVGGEHVADQVAMLTRMVERAGAEEREHIVTFAQGPRFEVSWDDEKAVAEEAGSGWRRTILKRSFSDYLGTSPESSFAIVQTESNRDPLGSSGVKSMGSIDEVGQAIHVSVLLSDGSWLNFRAVLESLGGDWSMRFGLSLGVMVIAVIVLSAIVVHRMSRPLRAFSAAAHRLGTDLGAPPLIVEGPWEVKEVISAINQAQRRLSAFVDDRTQMIAAISRDLRTPITRMRLRAEFVEDGEERHKMLSDLDDMEQIVASTLAFSGEDAIAEPTKLVDLQTLIDSLCDDWSDTGASVSSESEATGRTVVSCRPVALRRAFNNLIENAVNYGNCAHVLVHVDPENVTVTIEDDGPGIPEESYEDAFKPFFRLDASRNRETGGTGLGLAVARTVVRAHGGDIRLSNRAEGGLRAIVVLPL